MAKIIPSLCRLLSVVLFFMLLPAGTTADPFRDDEGNALALKRLLALKKFSKTIEPIKQQLIRGENLDLKGEVGRMLINAAAMLGDKLLAELVIAKGVNVNVKSNGMTPLQTALLANQSDVAEFLISKGANVKVKDKDGNTPLHHAASKGMERVAKLLISKGADVNIKNKEEDTPLHLAVGGQNISIIDLLLSKGADVNAKDKFGWTPRDQAVNRRNAYIVGLLTPPQPESIYAITGSQPQDLSEYMSENVFPIIVDRLFPTTLGVSFETANPDELDETYALKQDQRCRDRAERCVVIPFTDREGGHRFIVKIYAHESDAVKSRLLLNPRKGSLETDKGEKE